MTAGGKAYWARFELRASELLRFDTRVYLHPVDRPRAIDRPVGCIIGKNPGSAVPSQPSGGLQALELQGDHFLPSVRAVAAKSTTLAGVEPAPGAYVQVLNLFYLCNRDLRAAKRARDRTMLEETCATERRHFAWRWFAWGGPDSDLDSLKARFLRPRKGSAFYLDGASRLVVASAPSIGDKARHTQGMPHDRVVEHLANLTRRG